MLPQSSKTLLLALSLISSCAHGPKLDVCLSDPAKAQFDCIDKQKKAYVVPFEKTDNYVCMPPNDYEILLDYLKTQCK